MNLGECQRTGLFHGAASLSGHREVISVIHRHNSKMGDLHFTSWAVLSSGRCQELGGPAEPGLGTIPVHCSDTCLPSARPKLGSRAHLSQPTSCVSFHFREFIKVTSYGDTRNPVGRVPESERTHPSLLLQKIWDTGKYTVQLHSGSTFTGFCSLGFFLETDSTTKATD